MRTNCSPRTLSTLAVLSSFLLLLPGCSSRRVEPAIYPNAHSQAMGQAGTQRDIDDCNALAEQYVKDQDNLTKVARDSLTGAVIGSAGGALGGVIVGGNVGRSVGAGAAVGAIIPLLQTLLQGGSSAPTRTAFVQACMRDRGYQII